MYFVLSCQVQAIFNIAGYSASTADVQQGLKSTFNALINEELILVLILGDIKPS